ncbi:hypothetical protein V4F39_01905 [Aquincola sp. MAHUQ-54]|uniref:Uncharacterized protein n=1 Tax=Aquincola agrisoli TaxID=3119538 RepID=A0AAW9Q114_9BURK
MPRETQGRRSCSSDSKRSERVGVEGHQASAHVRIMSAEGRDGVLRFVLRRVAGGLYVEREELPRRGTRTSISVEFKDREGFERWCSDDPSRFNSPLLHRQVCRSADELWQMDS